jgi:PBSX family phage terminase large subunit
MYDVEREVNPLFYHVYKALEEKKYRNILIYGGSSAAKTYSFIQALQLIVMIENSACFILKKEATTLKHTIFRECKLQMTHYGLDCYYEAIENLLRAKKQKGSDRKTGEIAFCGLDDSEKVKGIVGYQRVLMEEVTQFDLEDWEQLNLRLRGVAGLQIIALWNPIDENHWLKTDVIDPLEWVELPKIVDEYGEKSRLGDESFVKESEDGTTLLIRTNYKDNQWIVGHRTDASLGFYDKDTILNFEKLKRSNYEKYRVYCLGEWGKMSSGGEAYKKFDPVNNVKKTEADPEKALWLSFDENVNPYMALSIWQGNGGKELNQVDEIALKDPKNTLKDTIREFCNIYREFKNSKIFITGDRTSKKQDVKLEKGQNFFTLIKTQLENNGFNNLTMKLPSKNPSVAARIAFINEIFDHENKDNITVNVGANCPLTIHDMNYVKEDKDGGKTKPKVKDKKTGITYETMAHFSDTTDYVICEYFKEEYLKYLNPKGRRTTVTPRAVNRNRY